MILCGRRALHFAKHFAKSQARRKRLYPRRDRCVRRARSLRLRRTADRGRGTAGLVPLIEPSFLRGGRPVPHARAPAHSRSHTR
jgi:hypothetical protein